MADGGAALRKGTVVPPAIREAANIIAIRWRTPAGSQFASMSHIQTISLHQTGQARGMGLMAFGAGEGVLARGLPGVYAPALDRAVNSILGRPSDGRRGRDTDLGGQGLLGVTPQAKAGKGIDILADLAIGHWLVGLDAQRGLIKGITVSAPHPNRLGVSLLWIGWGSPPRISSICK